MCNMMAIHVKTKFTLMIISIHICLCNTMNLNPKS